MTQDLEHDPAFSAVLRHYRRAAGLTQEELAERAGISERSINGMERGLQHVPRRDTVRLLAEALHLPPADRAAFEAAARGPDQPVLDTSTSRVAPSLPLPPTPLIGRARDVAALDALLHDPRV